MSLFDRLAYLAAHRRRLMLMLGGLALIAGLALTPAFQSGLRGVGYDTPASQSYRAAQFIASATGYSERDTLVVSSGRYLAGAPTFGRALAHAFATVRRVDAHARVLGPGTIGGGAISRDGRVVTATVELNGSAAHRQNVARALEAALSRAMPAGISAGVTGDSPLIADLTHVEDSEMAHAEMVGIPVAAIILLLAFGSGVAAGIPLLLGISGLLVSFGIVAGLMLLKGFNVFAESVMVMIGLAIGIDYALLLVRRFREERRGPGTPEEAMGRTLRTAGRTVMFSGGILSASLIPLVITGLPFFSDTALAVIVVILVEVMLLLTVLPAVLLALGQRLERLSLPTRLRGTERPADGATRWYRWAQGVMGHPWPVLLAGGAVLALCALPVLHIRTGIDLNARAMRGEPSVRPLTVLQRHLGSASLGPIEVLVRADGAALAPATGEARAVLTAQRQVSGVQLVPLRADAVLLLASPTVAVDSNAAANLVRRIRGGLTTAVSKRAVAEVTGVSAEDVDYSAAATRVTPWVMGFALLLAFALLMWLFRSPLLALKAIVLNLLTIGAAIGLCVLVFQDGHGERLLGFTSPGFLQSWVPLTMFVCLFGLSMDYEVFIVSRIREEWEQTGDPREAVARGLDRTGGVVTSAATIMMAIFASFLLVVIPEMKQLGFGLAVSVLIDATLVRAMLVPAFMRVAGRWNWWMPGRLDRLLPRLEH
jgi:RND superfamily putative drug exporter